MTDEQYRIARRPLLEQIGIDKRSIDYIISLERGTAEAIVASLAELRKTPAWEGRRCKLSSSGLILVHSGGIWRLAGI